MSLRRLARSMRQKAKALSDAPESRDEYLKRQQLVMLQAVQRMVDNLRQWAPDMSDTEVDDCIDSFLIGLVRGRLVARGLTDEQSIERFAESFRPSI